MDATLYDYKYVHVLNVDIGVHLESFMTIYFAGKESKEKQNC